MAGSVSAGEMTLLPAFENDLFPTIVIPTVASLICSGCKVQRSRSLHPGDQAESLVALRNRGVTDHRRVDDAPAPLLRTVRAHHLLHDGEHRVDRFVADGVHVGPPAGGVEPEEKGAPCCPAASCRSPGRRSLRCWWRRALSRACRCEAGVHRTARSSSAGPRRQSRSRHGRAPGRHRSRAQSLRRSSRSTCRASAGRRHGL